MAAALLEHDYDVRTVDIVPPADASAPFLFAHARRSGSETAAGRSNRHPAPLPFPTAVAEDEYEKLLHDLEVLEECRRMLLSGSATKARMALILLRSVSWRS
ncbi:MAG: hypothetical protein ACRDNP_06770 [Gaiellaceae bacterium]